MNPNQDDDDNQKKKNTPDEPINCSNNSSSGGGDGLTAEEVAMDVDRAAIPDVAAIAINAVDSEDLSEYGQEDDDVVVAALPPEIRELIQKWYPPSGARVQEALSNLEEFLRSKFSLDEKTLRAIARRMEKHLRDDESGIALAVEQSMTADGKFIFPRPELNDTNGKNVGSSLFRTNHTSAWGPCSSSSLGSHESAKNAGSGKPKKNSRGIKYKCDLCGTMTKQHSCRLPVSKEGVIKTRDGKLWRVRPLKTKPEEELKESAMQRAIAMQTERSQSESEASSSESEHSSKGREKYDCNRCGRPKVDSDGQPHVCIFPAGSRLFMGDGEQPMVAIPLNEENHPAEASDDDDDDDDLDRKPPAAKSKGD